MNTITPENAASQDFMSLIEELTHAYNAFSFLNARGHRQSGSGLTVSQADVIFTLGNSDGMTCKEIGDHTLITKGTLTGVIDRLEDKGLVERWADDDDGRKTIIALTRLGIRVFRREFPRHVEFLKTRFDELSDRERRQAIASLQRIREIF
jgi:DNA-binding MarR family transcriptional regulator